jgi:tRNA-specific 2-thiouridylase
MKNTAIAQKTIHVALSGGVDSAVSAALLKKEGHNIVGVFMKNWSGDDYGIQADCPWEEDQKMAEAVAKHLEIPFKSYNFEKEYRDRVVKYFFDEYARGRTPNPDVMCNREIKFDLFLQRSLEEGADMIATGHYAQLTDGKLFKSKDEKKDQTYFLNALTKDQLDKTLFPIGHLTKKEVRKLAFDFKLPNANRKDSQGICFIGEIDVQEFLRKHISTKPGDTVDVDSNEVVGNHDGVYYYTIGQREGLGIGGQAIPYFVVDKDAERNILYVAHGHAHPALNKKVVQLENLHLIDPDTELPEKLSASVRYRQAPQVGQLDVEGLTFTFDEPQRAISPGQSLVLYSGDECLGGGVIEGGS